ncbi:hypothetical protein PTSG_03457 [Salpingoeca rosetta]|uniref:Protein LTV1 n=1 Tax=Salpingoeca rosetta (strain ATCC 50818 / BSB-021) TaxID=946362 RepID=F2U592_SALR5|nr:uncharacterized protein PTSG_03457 [Salpingoeca rosetta]EGD82808.1 hypothetical protein PTSG_03457 [Salpingoeca rosetta]|eukprot:XP_004996043.1 hypothetical protein PTSG_03457 [Salpingoeca rosetta]
MGKKSKGRKFIDKNDPNTFTFTLVHRSQHDPRAADPTASQYVLQPVESRNAARRKRREARKTRQPGQASAPSAASSATSHTQLPELGLPIQEEQERPQGRPRLGRQHPHASSRAVSNTHVNLDEGGHASDQDDNQQDTNSNERPEMYGIYYDDDYDYLQHLREPGAPGADTYFVDEQSKFEYLARQGVVQHDKLSLPEEVLPSVGEEEVGLLARAAPHSGPRLDWDPDVVEALDDDTLAVDQGAEEAGVFEDYLNAVLAGDEDNKYADDDDGDYFDDDDDDDDDDLRTPHQSDDEDGPHLAVSDDDGEDDDAEDDGRAKRNAAAGFSSYDDIWRQIGHGTRPDASAARAKTEVKSRFTEYSMTSSVLPRSEVLQDLDEGFEVFFEKYDDENIGSLDEIADEADMMFSESDVRALEEEMDDFCDEMKTMGLMRDKDVSYRIEREQTRRARKEQRSASAKQSTTAAAEHIKSAGGDDADETSSQGTIGARPNESDGEDYEDDDEEERVMVVVAGQPKSRREWDCESVLSLRSTLYNHPTVIDEGRGRRRQRGRDRSANSTAANPSKHIQIDPKTGIPVEGLALIGRAKQDDNDSDSDSDGPAPNLGESRPKNESKEEKKARKKAIKAQRQARRAQKKQTKQAFKEEMAKQQKMRAA